MRPSPLPPRDRPRHLEGGGFGDVKGVRFNRPSKLVVSRLQGTGHR